MSNQKIKRRVKRSKIERKLVKLGYKYCDDFMSVYVYVKSYYKYNLTIEAWPHLNKVIEGYVDLDGMSIYKQRDINRLQRAYNKLQQDIKEIEDD